MLNFQIIKFSLCFILRIDSRRTGKKCYDELYGFINHGSEPVHYLKFRVVGNERRREVNALYVVRYNGSKMGLMSRGRGGGGG